MRWWPQLLEATPVAVAGLLAGLVVLLVVGSWLSWTASRLGRLHARIDAARAVLVEQLLRRSGAALELSTSGALDPARALLLLDAAHAARAAPPGEMAMAESDLSKTLRAVLADDREVASMRRDAALAPLLAELAATSRTVELARRFHNDVVASARVLRSRRRVRWLRLAGHAQQPLTVDLDDVPPDGLRET